MDNSKDYKKSEVQELLDNIDIEEILEFFKNIDNYSKDIYNNY